jgi:hypothetical protein
MERGLVGVAEPKGKEMVAESGVGFIYRPKSERLEG